MTEIESRIKGVLPIVFEAYRTVLGSDAWSAVPFDVRVTNDILHITLKHAGRPRSFSGRLSSVALLSGKYWANACFPDDLLEICPTWLPTLSTSTPPYLRVESPYGYDFIQRNEEFVAAMIEAGRAFLEAGEEQEAVLCFRRSADQVFDVVHESVAPPELKTRVAGVTNTVRG